MPAAIFFRFWFGFGLRFRHRRMRGAHTHYAKPAGEPTACLTEVTLLALHHEVYDRPTSTARKAVTAVLVGALVERQRGVAVLMPWAEGLAY